MVVNRRGNTIAASGTPARATGANITPRLSLPESAAASVLGRASTAGQATDITSSADGDVLRRSGSTVGWGAIPQASVTNLVADLATLTAKVQGDVDVTGVTTTLATPVSTAIAFPLVVGTYLFVLAGTYATAVNTTAIRMTMAGSGGLVVSGFDLQLSCYTAATTTQPSVTSTLGTLSAGTTGVVATTPWFAVARAVVTTAGTITLQVASEVAGSSVTVSNIAATAIRVA